MYLTFSGVFPVSATQSNSTMLEISIGLLKQSIKVIKKGDSVGKQR